MIMTINSYFFIGSSIFGLLVFGYSVFKVLDIIKLLPKESKTKQYWNYAIILIILFMLGYLFSIFVIATENTSLLDTITPIIYILGSIFVFIMVTVSLRTYKAILESAE